MTEVLYVRSDGTFVVLFNGLPYHVEKSDPMFDEVAEAARGVNLPPEPGPPSLPPAPPIRKIAPLAFRDRLADRLPALTVAAFQSLRADPPDPTLQMMLDSISSARFVDLDESRLAAGMAMLVQIGLLTTDERDILLSDGTEDERPV
jgi:hypothetical protein